LSLSPRPENAVCSCVCGLQNKPIALGLTNGRPFRNPRGNNLRLRRVGHGKKDLGDHASRAGGVSQQVAGQAVAAGLVQQDNFYSLEVSAGGGCDQDPHRAVTGTAFLASSRANSPTGREWVRLVGRIVVSE